MILVSEEDLQELAKDPQIAKVVDNFIAEVRNYPDWFVQETEKKEELPF